MLLQVENISKSYGSRLLFENVSFKLEDGNRLALVGPNGAGKTTLLNILTGQDFPDTGKVIAPKGVRVGYLEQEAIEMEDNPIFEEVLSAQGEVIDLEKRMQRIEAQLSDAPTDQLIKELGRARDAYESMGGYQLESKVRSILFGIGFTEEDLSRRTSDFSGGWQMRIALAKLLVRNPEVLLLDEPTNHLDLDSVSWLEGFIRSYEGAVIVVSHDRAFMDSIANIVAEIDNGKVMFNKGNYSAYLKAREQRIELLKAQRKSQLEEIAKLDAFVEKFRYKATKAKQAQDRLKKADRLREELVEVPEEKKAIRFDFVQPPRTGEDVCTLENVSKSFDDKVVFENLGLKVYRGDKIALVGPNGAGKSTLMKMIAHVLQPDSGTIEYGLNVECTYYAQHQLEGLCLENTVFQELNAVAPNWSITQVRSLLGAFLFKGDDVDKLVSVLSGGEKSRLALAKMLVAPSPLLCLDEPTNHLDIDSVSTLEQALQQFDGTIVLVSHDRRLVSAVATRIIEVKDGRIRSFDGDYDYYLYKSEEMDGADEASAFSERYSETSSSDKRPSSSGPSITVNNHRKPSAAQRTSGKRTKEEKRAQAIARNAMYAATKDIKKRISAIEKEMEASSARMDEILALMSEPEFYVRENPDTDIIQEHGRLKSKIDDLEARWLEANEELEEAMSPNKGVSSS